MIKSLLPLMTRRHRPIAPLLLAMAAFISFTSTAALAGSRYKQNGDEVLDTQTGLIWRTCSEGQTWTGTGCINTSAKYGWVNAFKHAQAVAQDTGLPWRVPNVKELSGLIDLTHSKPAIDSTAFPSTPSDYYWASTPSSDDAHYFRLVEFQYGASTAGSQYNSHLLRLVRSQ